MGPHVDSSLAHRDQSAQGSKRPGAAAGPSRVGLRVLTSGLAAFCGLGWLATSYLDALASGRSRQTLRCAVTIALGWMNPWLVGTSCALAALGLADGLSSPKAWAMLSAWIGATLACVVSAQLQAPSRADRAMVAQLGRAEWAAMTAQLAIIATSYLLGSAAVAVFAPLGRAALMVPMDRARAQLAASDPAASISGARMSLAGGISILSLGLLTTLLSPSPAPEVATTSADCVEVADPAFEISPTPGGVRIRTSDGGGAGDVHLPLNEALKHLHTQRCGDHYEIAMTARSGKVYVVKASNEGVRLDDGLVTRAAVTRFHRLVLAELLALLALLVVLGRLNVRARDVR